MAPTQPFRILLVEDDEVDIQSVERALSKLDKPSELQSVKNGIEAIDLLYGLNGKTKLDPLPDLIILDINMPMMNGIEFLSKMRADVQFSGINVVILSTSNDYHDKAAAFNLNIAGYFLKPLQVDEFISLCKILLG